MLKIGHRGAAGLAPENTLASIQAALDFKVHMIEFDVRTCRSGEVVLMHDATLERTTNARGPVKDFAIEALEQIDAGEGEPVPTLEKALKLINRQARAMIELKDEASTEPVAKLIGQLTRAGWRYEELVVVSFDHPQLQRIKKLDPNILVGANIVGVPVDLAAFGERCGAWAINAGYHHLPPEMISDAKARNLKIFAWTVDSVRDIEEVRALKVDGIISNYPDLLKW